MGDKENKKKTPGKRADKKEKAGNLSESKRSVAAFFGQSVNSTSSSPSPSPLRANKAISPETIPTPDLSSSEEVTVPIKRKTDDNVALNGQSDPPATGEGSANVTPTKESTRKKIKMNHASTPETPASHSLINVGFKKGKIIFEEKRLNLQRHRSTVAELAEFLEFGDSQGDNVLTELPERFRGLLAKLVEESCMEQSILAKNIQEALCPLDFEETAKGVIGVEPICTAIGQIATRENYGVLVDGSDHPSLSVWRWEVKDMSLFPSDMADRIIQRRAQRRDAAATLQAIWGAMAEEEQQRLFPSIKAPNADTKVKIVPDADAKKAAAEARQKEKERKTAEKAAEKAAATAERDRKAAEKKAEKDKKAAEKQAEKDRKAAEKKAEKERLEAEKAATDEALKAKQPSIAGFFAKPKKVSPKADPVVENKPEIPTFQEHFPPFHVKPNVTLAPANRFFREVPLSAASDWVDSDTPVQLPIFRRPAINTPRAADAPRDGPPRVKWKLLQFCENLRPAYWGTWSKKCSKITGRRPLRMDTEVLDYEYDSEAEWEDEEPGEELCSDEGGEDEDGSDAGDDENNWLVPHGYLSDDEGMADGEKEQSLRRAEAPKLGSGKNVKDRPKWGVLAPLVPEIIGPYFATSLEPESTPHPLSIYRAQILLGMAFSPIKYTDFSSNKSNVDSCLSNINPLETQSKPLS
ncbi:chromatin assembly factor 1 subunit A-domain-containing protein [Phlyctochytrium arcticum]|nr:chromatin assembly factor 1 subunit A-domain-containing protein [Phlyctochytrium arcticum]